MARTLPELKSWAFMVPGYVVVVVQRGPAEPTDDGPSPVHGLVADLVGQLTAERFQPTRGKTNP